MNRIDAPDSSGRWFDLDSAKVFQGLDNASTNVKFCETRLGTWLRRTLNKSTSAVTFAFSDEFAAFIHLTANNPSELTRRIWRTDAELEI